MLLGSRPTTTTIRQATKAREVDFMSEQVESAEETLRDQEEQISKITEQEDLIDRLTQGDMVGDMQRALGIEKKVSDAEVITYKGKNMEVDGVNVADITTKKEEVTPEEESKVEDTDFVMDDSGVEGDMDAFEGAPEGVAVDINALKERLNPEGSNEPNEYSLISELWESLTGKEKLLLASKDGIERNSLDGFIEEFKNIPFETSEKEFVDNIKICILGR